METLKKHWGSILIALVIAAWAIAALWDMGKDWYNSNYRCEDGYTWVDHGKTHGCIDDDLFPDSPVPDQYPDSDPALP